MSEVEHQQAPPVGEEIHLPGASLIPVVNAVGISLALIGLTTLPALIVIGLLIFFVSLIMWIIEARREFSELPPVHDHQ